MSIPDIKQIEKFIIDILILISTYLYEYIFLTRSIITKPKDTIHELILNETKSQLPAFLYFLINLMIAYLISHTDVAILQIAQEFFEKSKPTFGEFINDLFSYACGIVALILIFHYLNGEPIPSNNIKLLLRSLCYASAIFVPIAIIDNVVISLIWQKYMYAVVFSLDGLPTMGMQSMMADSSLTHMMLTSDTDTIKILEYWFFIIPFITHVIWLIWWAFLMYIGLKKIDCFERKTLLKNISKSIIIITVMQAALAISFDMEKNLLRLTAINLLISLEEESEVPRYGNMAFKYWVVSSIEPIPKVLRYESAINSVTYSLAAYNAKQDAFIIAKTYVKQKQYDQAYSYLSSVVSNTLFGKTTLDTEYSTLHLLKGILDDAKKYRAASDYKQSEREISVGLKSNEWKERRFYLKLIP